MNTTATATYTDRTRPLNGGRVYVSVATTCSYCGPLVNSGGTGDTEAEALAVAQARFAEHAARWHRNLQTGDGVSVRYPSDSLPYVVVGVSPNGKTAWLAPLDTNGATPDPRREGAYPVLTQAYTPEQLMDSALVWIVGYEGTLGIAEARRLHAQAWSLRSNGTWARVGQPRCAGDALDCSGAYYVRDYRD